MIMWGIMGNMKNIIDMGLDILFPPCCPFCGEVVGKKRGIRILKCDDCAKRISYVKEPRCLKCGKSLDEDKEYCTDCESIHHIYDQSCAVYEYSDVIKQSIYQYKYYNKREYVGTYAKDCVRQCGELIEYWKPDVMVPVPLHLKKLKKRGFNQAELLATNIGMQLNIEVDNTLLFRTRYTAPMKELDNKGRINNLKNAFQVSQNDVKYNKILLVDDIYTTGATLDACAKALKDAGVQKVYGVCLCVGRGF